MKSINAVDYRRSEVMSENLPNGIFRSSLLTIVDNADEHVSLGVYDFKFWLYNVRFNPQAHHPNRYGDI
jgi:hypothetical protein